MKKVFLFVGLLLLSNQIIGQSNWKNFWKQSAPIKKWILFHPFKAKKALKKIICINKYSLEYFNIVIFLYNNH